KKIRYTTNMKFVLSTYDMTNNLQLYTREFALSGSGNAPSVADQNAINNMRSSVRFYIEDNFKFRTKILELEKPDKKGKIKGLYINCGTTIGVKNGDLFIVYALDSIGGVETFRQIGRVRARIVMSDEVTFCSFSSGTTDIVAAYNGGATLMAVSAGEAIF
ncbi:MAG: hypothetical protein PHD21_02355, partial [Flavobacteriales bacterium]|nr:hypothetical protein [Flavobacteriales bacterium]